MGSFNTTCFASNQTIAPRDKARVLPIFRQQTYEKVQMEHHKKRFFLHGVTTSTCYPDAFWACLGPFFSAEYDDYGRFELTLSARQWRQLHKVFKEVLRSCPVVAAGKNEHHEPSFNFAAFLQEKAPGVYALCTGVEDMPVDLPQALEEEFRACWAYLWDAAQQHRVFYMDVDEPTPLQFAVMHEDVYQLLFARATSGLTYRGESRAPQAHVRRALEMAKSFAKRFGDKRESQAFAYDHQLSSSMAQLVNMNSRGFDDFLGSERWDLLEQMMSGTLSEDDLVEKIAEQLTDTYVMASLDELNLKLSPMVYAGQDYHNEIGQSYGQFIAQASARVTRSRMESLYGSFKCYKLQAPDMEAVTRMENDIAEWDAAIADVATQPVEGGLAVTFSCTLDPEDVAQFLQESGDEAGMMAGTLAQNLKD